MTSQDKLFFTITSGPNKFDLMLALFDANNKFRRTVEFHLEGVNDPITVSISMLEHEDGSGESWMFKGRANSSFSIRGYYSTKSRRGNLTFMVPYHEEMMAGQMLKVVRSTDQQAVEKHVDVLRTRPRK